MKSIIILIAIILTSTLHSQWIEQTSGITQSIYDITMLSNDIAIAIGDNGKIIRTTNGGLSWGTLASGTTNSLNKICFINSNTGYIYGDAVLLKTSDTGNSWNSVGSNIESGFGKIFFIDASTGWITTNGPTIKKTTNGGMNWTNSSLPVNSQSGDIWFLNSNTGYCCGTKPVPDSTIIFKTFNGGTTWTVFHAQHIFYDRMYVLDISDIYLCGFLGKFAKTNDLGVSWQTYNFPDSDYYHGVRFINNTTGYVCGDEGNIFATFDGGMNWESQSVYMTSALTCMAFSPGLNEVGYAAGSDGKILKTTDGGVIGIQQTGYEVPSGFSLSQNYPNPFNPATNIKFNISKAGLVKLVVFDVTGREVAQLVNENLKAGTYKFDFDASHLSSGVYFYKLIGDGFSEVKKMILVK